MNLCIAILAHSGAAETIKLFEPRWRRLRAPIYAFVPEGDTWPGGPVSGVIQCGASARLGEPVFRRFYDACRMLLASDYDAYLIAEYDTVNLSDRPPMFAPGMINCGYVEVFGPFGAQEIKCCLSPWMVSRCMLAALAEAAKCALAHPPQDPQAAWVGGYLDRWIGYCAWKYQLPVTHLPELMPYPWCETEDVHARIVKEHLTWVHGWKTKEEFKHLWPA